MIMKVRRMSRWIRGTENRTTMWSLRMSVWKAEQRNKDTDQVLSKNV